MKNKITFTFIFTLLVVAGLLALYYLPPVNLNGTPLRKVDLLSDLRPDPVVEEVSDSDSIPLPVVAKPVFVDTCKTGMTCIEDYTDSLGLGMGAFTKPWRTEPPWADRYVSPISAIPLSKAIS